MNKKLFWWLMVILWCLVIFYQSGKPADKSGKDSIVITRFINSCIRVVTGTDKLAVSEFIVRKAAHFTEYFILGCLLFNGLQNRKKLVFSLILSNLFGIIYAVSDEIHQFFVDGRAATVFDVTIDYAGVFTGAYILFFAVVIRKRRTSAKP